MHAAHALEHCFETPRLGTQEGVAQKETLSRKILILRWNMYTRICVPSRFLSVTDFRAIARRNDFRGVHEGPNKAREDGLLVIRP